MVVLDRRPHTWQLAGSPAVEFDDVVIAELLALAFVERADPMGTDPGQLAIDAAPAETPGPTSLVRATILIPHGQVDQLVELTAGPDRIELALVQSLPELQAFEPPTAEERSPIPVADRSMTAQQLAKAAATVAVILLCVAWLVLRTALAGTGR